MVALVMIGLRVTLNVCGDHYSMNDNYMTCALLLLFAVKLSAVF